MKFRPYLTWLKKRMDWDTFGHDTVLKAHDESSGIEECRHNLQDYELQLRPEIDRLNSEVEHLRANRDALHAHLYNRPVPVNDAAMLTHNSRVKHYVALSIFLAATCVVTNLITLLLFGLAMFVAIIGAIFIAALPAAVCHPVFEKVLNHCWVKNAVLATMAALASLAFYDFGQSRKVVMAKATETAAVNSYVDDGADDPRDGPKPQSDDEARAHETLGSAFLLITIAAELSLGLSFAMVIKLRTDEDYAAWHKLTQLVNEIIVQSTCVAELTSQIDRSKQQCMAGIRRAQGVRSKRRPPYHKVLALLALVSLLGLRVHAQAFEGILIDTSISIQRNRAGGDLFQAYLRSTKRLLATEPPNTHVWVSTIAADSFGGVD